MQTFFNILNDILIIVGNIIIFSCMLNLKDYPLKKKLTLIFSCLVLIVLYIIFAYVVKMPLIEATLLCFTIPSLILFWGICEIKDARYLFTFSLVDTLSLIVAFISKCCAISYPNIAPYITFFINSILYTWIITAGYKYFHMYADILQRIKNGWWGMTIASIIIYVAFYVLAVYPTPIATRMEYALPYFVFCGVVVSCYVVFIGSIIKTAKLNQQYEQLREEQNFHKVAYTDPLTGLYNRVYYAQVISQIQKSINIYNYIGCIVIDVNNLKMNNDKYGHHFGDVVLQEVANNISRVFKNFSSYMFRTGGDEFFVLLLDVQESDIQKSLKRLDELIAVEPRLAEQFISVASGYSVIDTKNNKNRITIEKGFMEADKRMYEDKKQYKLAHQARE